jgi:hypothetical protein
VHPARVFCVCLVIIMRHGACSFREHMVDATSSIPTHYNKLHLYMTSVCTFVYMTFCHMDNMLLAGLIRHLKYVDVCLRLNIVCTPEVYMQARSQDAFSSSCLLYAES